MPDETHCRRDGAQTLGSNLPFEERLAQKKAAALRDLAPGPSDGAWARIGRDTGTDAERAARPRFRAAIFDFDGTLADSHDVWRRVDQDFFEKRGIPCSPEYAEQLSLLGFEAGARFTIAEYGLDETVEDICAEWNAAGRALYATDVDLRPGARRYIEALAAAGVPRALATTNDPEVIDAMAPRLVMDDLTPVRVHGCQVARSSKEFPDIYLEAATRLGVPPSSCVVFEDLLAAMRTAHAAGMAVAGVLTGEARQDVRAIVEACDYIIDDWRMFG